jgi:AraC family transcriptional regulator
MGAMAQTGRASGQPLEKLLPALVHIQAHLDEDLSLGALSERAQVSRFHFHRMFRAGVGETLKQYCLRLRLERAANRLVLHEATILDVALDCGFQNHETFARDFKRRFRVTPRDYREAGRASMRKGAPKRTLDLAAVGGQLSETKVKRLAPLDLAFIRHTGPYEQVPDTLWQELAEWAAKRFPQAARVFMGIAHDAPSVTPAEKLRFDAAVVVPGPFAAEGRIGHQRLDGGECALTTHVGHYRTLSKVYEEIVGRVFKLKGYRLIGLPGIEVYHTTQVNAQAEMNHTDIYLPVARAGLRA